VVLYLVNSSEAPQDAGYLPAEMKILAWLGRPVVVLLNQMGPPRPAPEEQPSRRAGASTWRAPIVRGVLALDAFARCWVHENVFYEAVGRVLEPAKREGYARLLAVWEGNNLSRFEDAMRVTAQLLLESARDTEAIETGDAGLLKSAMKAVGLGKAAQEQLHKKAMKVLLTRLNARIVAATTKLLVLHKLDPGQAVNINTRVRVTSVRAPIDKAQAGPAGGVVSGAATGLVGRSDGRRPDLRRRGAARGYRRRPDGGRRRLGFQPPPTVTGRRAVRGCLPAHSLLVGRDAALPGGGPLRPRARQLRRGRGAAFWQAEVERGAGPHRWGAVAGVRAAPDRRAARRSRWSRRRPTPRWPSCARRWKAQLSARVTPVPF
jgi:hypothetical protein